MPHIRVHLRSGAQRLLGATLRLDGHPVAHLDTTTEVEVERGWHVLQLRQARPLHIHLGPDDDLRVEIHDVSSGWMDWSQFEIIEESTA